MQTVLWVIILPSRFPARLGQVALSCSSSSWETFLSKLFPSASEGFLIRVYIFCNCGYCSFLSTLTHLYVSNNLIQRVLKIHKESCLNSAGSLNKHFRFLKKINVQEWFPPCQWVILYLGCLESSHQRQSEQHLPNPVLTSFRTRLQCPVKHHCRPPKKQFYETCNPEKQQQEEH